MKGREPRAQDNEISEEKLKELKVKELKELKEEIKNNFLKDKKINQLEAIAKVINEIYKTEETLSKSIEDYSSKLGEFRDNGFILKLEKEQEKNEIKINNKEIKVSDEDKVAIDHLISIWEEFKESVFSMNANSVDLTKYETPKEKIPENKIPEDKEREDKEREAKEREAKEREAKAREDIARDDLASHLSLLLDSFANDKFDQHLDKMAEYAIVHDKIKEEIEGISEKYYMQRTSDKTIFSTPLYDLRSALIAPAQRGPRYRLFLEDLERKLLPESKKNESPYKFESKFIHIKDNVVKKMNKLNEELRKNSFLYLNSDAALKAKGVFNGITELVAKRLNMKGVNSYDISQSMDVIKGLNDTFDALRNTSAKEIEEKFKILAFTILGEKLSEDFAKNNLPSFYNDLNQNEKLLVEAYVKLDQSNVKLNELKNSNKNKQESTQVEKNILQLEKDVVSLTNLLVLEKQQYNLTQAEAKLRFFEQEAKSLIEKNILSKTDLDPYKKSFEKIKKSYLEEINDVNKKIASEEQKIKKSTFIKQSLNEMQSLVGSATAFKHKEMIDDLTILIDLYCNQKGISNPSFMKTIASTFTQLHDLSKADVTAHINDAKNNPTLKNHLSGNETILIDAQLRLSQLENVNGKKDTNKIDRLKNDIAAFTNLIVLEKRQANLSQLSSKLTAMENEMKLLIARKILQQKDSDHYAKNIKELRKGYAEEMKAINKQVALEKSKLESNFVKQSLKKVKSEAKRELSADVPSAYIKGAPTLPPVVRAAPLPPLDNPAPLPPTDNPPTPPRPLPDVPVGNRKSITHEHNQHSTGDMMRYIIKTHPAHEIPHETKVAKVEPTSFNDKKRYFEELTKPKEFNKQKVTDKTDDDSDSDSDSPPRKPKK